MLGMTVPLMLQPDPSLLRSLVQVPPMYSLEMLQAGQPVLAQRECQVQDEAGESLGLAPGAGRPE